MIPCIGKNAGQFVFCVGSSYLILAYRRILVLRNHEQAHTLKNSIRSQE